MPPSASLSLHRRLFESHRYSAAAFARLVEMLMKPVADGDLLYVVQTIAIRRLATTCDPHALRGVLSAVEAQLSREHASHQQLVQHILKAMDGCPYGQLNPNTGDWMYRAISHTHTHVQTW